MGEDIGKQVGRFFSGLRQKTVDAVAKQEAAFVRGKVAGSAVMDDAGNVLVDAGHVIDDEAIERAARAGKLHAVVAAAGAAQIQDLKEKAGAQLASTEGGQEAAALNSAEEYAAARRYIGRAAALDVTDVRGTIVVPAGKEIKEDDVRLCREAGLLSALTYSAQQSPPPGPRPPARAADTTEAPSAYRPQTAQPAAPQPRARLPLVTPEEKPPV